MDSDSFFGDPAPSLEDDKDGYGRYLLDADGTGRKPYTRATTIAKMLDNTNGLEVWMRRKVAKGVASSPALTARAAVTPLDDRQNWRDILDQAETLSGGDEKRDLGSAFHTFHECVGEMSDEEYAAVPHELRVTYERYRAELDRLGIVEVMTEVTVVNTRIGTAGKFDALFRLADGRIVIGDRKTGNILKYPHSAAVQLAIYANADVMITWDENGAAIRHAMPEVDLTTAIVVDITIGGENTAATHVYEVDIWAGWAAALLSTKVRRWRNRRDLVTPYHPEPFMLQARSVADAGAVSMVRNDPAEICPDRPSEQPSVIAQDYRGGPAEVKRIVTDASGVEWVAPMNATVDDATNVVGPEAMALPENQAWFEQNAPGQSQPVEPAHGPEANGNTGMSATAKAVLGTGPAIGTGNATQPPHAGTHPAWSSKDQKVIELDSKGERVPEPEQAIMGAMQTESDTAALLLKFKTKADLQGVLAKVSPGANLARTRANLAKDVVSHPSWPQRRAEFLPPDGPSVPNVGTVTQQTDVLPSANPFAAPPSPEPAAAPEEPLEDQLLRKIGEATTQQDLADIWQEANNAGIGWPARLHQAATIRAKHFTAAPAAQ